MGMGRISRNQPITFEGLEKRLSINGDIEAIDVDHVRGIVNIVYLPYQKQVSEGASIPQDPILTSDDEDDVRLRDDAAHQFGIMDLGRRD